MAEGHTEGLWAIAATILIIIILATVTKRRV
jgi:hypothetical protein